MMKKHRKERWVAGRILGAILLAGLLFTWWAANRADQEMHRGLLQQADLIAQAVNPERLAALTGTAADLNTPDYLRIKKQLAAIKRANDRCRFIYLMGRRPDGQVFFFVDNEPVGSEDESPAGQLYEEISPEYLRVFDSGKALSVGPATDRWGTWISALVPLTDPLSGELIAVLGMDVDARTWKREVAAHILMFAGPGYGILLALLAALVVFLLRRTDQTIATQQTQLNKNELLFSKTFQAGSTLKAITDMKSGLFTHVNQTFLDTLGYTLDEVIGKSPIELGTFVRPEDMHRVLSMVEDVGFANNVEVEIRLKNGETRTGLFSADPIEMGPAPCLLTTMTDITDRKLVEEVLREKQAHLALALQSAQLGTWRVDITENKRYYGARCFQILGIDPNTFKGTADEFYRVVHPDDIEMLKKAMSESIAQNSPYELEYRIIWPDGTLHYIASHALLIRDEEGRPTKIDGLVEDITKKKLTGQALEEERQRLANVIQGTRVGIWEWNVQTGEGFCNERWAEIIGYTLEELMPVSSNTWSSLVHPDDLQKSKVLMGKHFSGDLPYYDNQLRIKHKDGHWVWTQDRGQVMTWTNDGKPLVMFGTHMDITEAKQAEEELEESNLQLEEAMIRAHQMAREAELANAAKSSFLANMSHEIRTPMNGVIGMTGLLLDTELTETQHQYTEAVRTSGESLLGLLNDILDFSKIEAGKLDLEMLDFDLQTLLDDLASTLAIQAHDKGIELLCGIAPEAPVLLRGDPGRLRQILTNLTGNAIKFTQAGEVAVRIAMESETEKTVRLRFSIRDTGIGIPDNKIRLLFEKFSQLDASTTRNFGGSGLGLAISKQLVEMMDGKMGVTSREGAGSEFWFTARLEKQAAETQGEASPPPADLAEVSVLIVDDNATNREMLNTCMTSWGMRVSEVGDGPSALLAFQQAVEKGDPFQVAVIDMQMPDMDGPALGRAVREDARLAKTRMVLLTSLGVRGDAKCFAEIGFNAYLTKPTRTRELKAVLSQVLVSSGGEAATSHAITTRHTTRETINLFAGCNVRILLVEDNITNQQVAVGILSKLGLTADVAANGAEAIKALESTAYDLVIMDVQMPVMDGYEATAQIRNPRSAVSNHDIPVIAMTAHAMADDRIKCLKAGMNDYLSKPINPDALAETLAKWLPPHNMTRNEVKRQPEEIITGQTASSEPAVWDSKAMMERLMGDEPLARKVIAGFLMDIPLQIEQLSRFMEIGDIQDVERQAHTIKGASANVGGDALKETAFAIEKAARAGNLHAAQADLEELKRRFDCLKKAIAETSCGN